MLAKNFKFQRCLQKYSNLMWNPIFFIHEWSYSPATNKDIITLAGADRCPCIWYHGPLARYANLRVAHALGMPGTFSPPPRVSDPYMHHGTCVTHVPGCMPGSLTSGFLWSRWRGKRSRHSRRMRNLQFYVSGKRPMDMIPNICDWVLQARDC